MSRNHSSTIIETIPIVQIRPNMLIRYNLNIHSGYRRKLSGLLNKKEGSGNEGSTIDNLKGKGGYSGDMTIHSIKRLRRCINNLVAIAEWKEAKNFKTGKYFRFKLNFITLTLPSPQGAISDKQLKKDVLDVWIKAAKRRFGMKSYLWKAEKQKNGNLHFHFTTNTYIPFDQLRDTWNDRLERLGFISRFEEKHGHRHPNSTDVHATYKIKNLANYLVKYLSKSNTDGVKIEGKLWDCSENLKQKIRCELEVDLKVFNWLEEVRDKYVNQYKELDQCQLLYLNDSQFNKEITGLYREKFEEWKSRIRSFERPKRMKKTKDNSRGPEPKKLVVKQILLPFKIKFSTRSSVP